MPNAATRMTTIFTEADVDAFSRHVTSAFLAVAKFERAVQQVAARAHPSWQRRVALPV